MSAYDIPSSCFRESRGEGRVVQFRHVNTPPPPLSPFPFSVLFLFFFLII